MDIIDLFPLIVLKARQIVLFFLQFQFVNPESMFKQQGLKTRWS